MEELLAAAAEAMNAPEAMVERSAQARAKASGASVEDVLRAWAGGGDVAASAPAASEPEATPAASEPAAAPAPATPAKAEPPAPADAVGEAQVIAVAAKKMNMPESMIERSAKARAKASESTYHKVLAEWAGVDESQITAAPPAAEAAPEPAAEAPAAEAPAAAPAPAPAAASGAGMDDAALLAAAAEKMGMPESMVKRSAGARAKAQDTTVEAVLAEWAGVEAPATAAAAPAAAAPAAEAPAPAPAAAPAEPETPDIEVIGSDDETPVEEPAARRGRPADDDLEPEAEAVAAGALPRWLAALFVFVPAFAIAYALFLPNGPNCGDAGSLAVDPVTGVAVNCDLSEFGSVVADYFAIGAETYEGIGCIACHGAGGGGVASFPAFTGGELLSTFPEGQCAAQIEWISLGTQGWPEETYGATNKPVGGSGALMPAFANTLDPEEIAAVALYERVAFGGQDLESALVDCGLAEGEGETAAAGE